MLLCVAGDPRPPTHARPSLRAQAVAESMAAQVADLRFRNLVERLEWGGGGVRVTCAGGATMRADAAIVTVSLGVLQARHVQLFSPPLPPAKVAALGRLRIGIVDKLMLDFAPAGTSCDAAGGTAAPHADPVAFALLWGEPWDGARTKGGTSPALSPAEAALPAWARGIP